MKFKTQTGAIMESNNTEVIAQLEKYYEPVAETDKSTKTTRKSRAEVEED